MANADLQIFLEDRLRALDPTIDLSTGSPAQTQFIEPVLTYLGTDPFETSIQSFISDRFAQEFPDVYAEDPGVINDVFVKPLILLLEPFKREIQLLKKNQSLQDPTILSDEDADALVANVFAERSSGGYSVGTARLYFTNPTNIQVQITNRVFTAGGLGFYPTNPVSITAEEMVFNKTGTQFYFDVPVQSEDRGDEYNIDVNQLTGVDGLFGVVRVSNLQKFTGGSTAVDTPTFVASAREALNERSLVTRRGATARLNDVFQTELRAVQVIGAKDEEMERDILVASSPGHFWIEGQVSLYQNMALVQASLIDGEESDAPIPGDTLFVYLDKDTYPAVPQSNRFVRLTVESVFVGPLPVSTPYQTLYLVQFSGQFPAGVSIIAGAQFRGGFSKKGTVQVSSLPSVGAVDLTVPNAEVHVYGHTDYYIRPILQTSSTAVMSGIRDSDSLVERLTLQTYGAATSERNKVSDPGIDFEAAGIRPGDLLSIETGDDVGVYVITTVFPSAAYLSANLLNSQNNLRYRVIRSIKLDPFEPKILKFPFGSLLANDLQTTIGSNLYKLTTNDLVSFGAKVGDTLRIKTGVAAGDYTITAFDTLLGGQGPILDRPAAGTSSAVQYEVFSPLEALERPLVRVKEVTLLDSSGQSTAITIPPAHPVGVTPTSAFTSAKVRGSSQRLSGFVLPGLATTSLTTFISGASMAAASGDRRYSLGFDPAVGIYKPVQFPDASYAELDYHANPAASTGDALSCSYFVATIEETQQESTVYPPVDPRPGDALSIKNGPNKGDYLIQSVYKFKHKETAPSREVWTYFIRISGKFPVDVLGQLFDFLNSSSNPSARVTELPITGAVAYPSFFTNLYASLGTKLRLALLSYGVSFPPSAATLQGAIDQMVFTQYLCGTPARGTLRTYMLSPTLFEMKTGSDSPTVFSFKNTSGGIVKYRPDFGAYGPQQIVPAKTTADAEISGYPRDLDVARTLSYTAQSSNFNVGKVLTGSSSGATALIAGDSDAGSSGTLTLTNVVGTFVPGELVFDNGVSPGAATVASVATANLLTFTDTSVASASVLGVRPGDVLVFHEEVFFHGTDGSRQSAVQTVAGSSTITAPSTSGNIFTNAMVGNLIAIDQGVDRGVYRVTSFVDGKTLVIDKAFTASTPTILAQGTISTWGWDGSNNKVTSAGFDFSPYIGKSLTMYGMSYAYQGSYLIDAAPALGTAYITRTEDFVTGMSSESDAHFVITNAPAAPVSSVLSGTELYGVTPFRMYDATEDRARIDSVKYENLAVSQVVLDTPSDISPGVGQPYKIVRDDVRRITPAQMSENSFGSLAYFDTDVVSFTPEPSANISADSYLTVEEPTYSSIGYRHIVDDRTLTYSMRETGTLELPTRILPTDSPDSQDSYLNLIGSSVQITYEQSELVRRIQEFADSAQDRVTSANLLVRHFLPSYVSYEATYTGGSNPGIIVTDILSYINTLPVESAIDVSQVQDLIGRRGGNPITPTYVQTLTHDWSRRVWMELSSNQLGGTTTLVPYDGTARVSYYVPGPDTSGQDPQPTGERINLTRL